MPILSSFASTLINMVWIRLGKTAIQTATSTVQFCQFYAGKNSICQSVGSPLPNLSTREQISGGRRHLLSRGVQMQRFCEPRRHHPLDRFFASIVEVVAAGNDFHVARPAGARLEILRRVILARLLVAAHVERRAFDRRCEREAVRRLGEAVEVALGADRGPP